MNPPSASSNRCILVFVRAPQPGFVKTRLESALSRPQVVALYRAFVEDIVATLDGEGFLPRICYCPADQEPLVRKWLGANRTYWAQVGENLGQRMANALAAAFADGYDQVLLVGSDLPDLPAEIIHQAFFRLCSARTVIGPAMDGGYYLIGFRADSFAPEIFSQIPWGTDQVLKKTIARMAEHGLACHRLPPWPDVDEPADLNALAERLGRSPGTALNTAALLDSIPGIDEIVVKQK